ncbi:MAG: hypothetical protein HC881_19020 [Leptolyngbyaceae cyanobacterium SL_7_1]|nr:hypothetical protein [Leptolyngbyaceae cyanobacterium SL_7_1]
MLSSIIQSDRPTLNPQTPGFLGKAVGLCLCVNPIALPPSPIASSNHRF